MRDLLLKLPACLAACFYGRPITSCVRYQYLLPAKLYPKMLGPRPLETVERNIAALWLVKAGWVACDDGIADVVRGD
jgi:hypothetical protein